MVRLGLLVGTLAAGAAIVVLPAVASAEPTGPSERGSTGVSSPRSGPPRTASPAAASAGPRAPVTADRVAARRVSPATTSVPAGSAGAPRSPHPTHGARGAKGGPGAPRATAIASTAGSVVSLFFGDGTASHPHAGILAGNGFSYDAQSCPGVNACHGGNGGLLAGNGGGGWNGGSGGSAGWFGSGGAGGPGRPGESGGSGGAGGRFLGDGGVGGAGGEPANPGGTGGTGGAGGDVGSLSVWGAGGDGGRGGPGAAGGDGGDGSYVFGVGGDGGPAGAGGTPGQAGSARLLFIVPRNGAAGLDNALVYFLDDTSQTVNTPAGYGVIGEFSAAQRATLTDGGRVVGESVALQNNDGTDGYSLWPLIKDLFTTVVPVPDADKLALAQTILSRVLLYPGLGPSDEFPSPAEGTPTSEGGYVFWAQDYEFNPNVASTDGAYAGVLATMWAGRQVLGDSLKILPVPSSSLFKTLAGVDGPYNSGHIIHGDGTTPYLASLGLVAPPATNPAAGSHGEWNFLSLAYANNLIDGFIGQQYNASSTGTVTADTLAFYSAALPYALMSSYDHPPQVKSGGPRTTVYSGIIPFHAGVYWPGPVDPSWGQPPSTNQKLIPTPAPLPT